MKFNQHQSSVDSRISQFKEGYWNNDKILWQMVEELGEVSKVLSYMDWTKKPKKWETIESLGAEISDLLFSIICMANKNNIDLDEEFTKMMQEKRRKRDNNRFEKKESE